MEVTINGMKIQIEGANDAQVFFDQETNTVKVQVQQKIIEKIKVVEVKGKDTVQFIPAPVVQPFPLPVVPWKPYFPWNNWERWMVCGPNQVVTTTTTNNTGFIKGMN